MLMSRTCDVTWMRQLFTTSTRAFQENLHCEYCTRNSSANATSNTKSNENQDDGCYETEYPPRPHLLWLIRHSIVFFIDNLRCRREVSPFPIAERAQAAAQPTLRRTMATSFVGAEL
jgi:hypothetical protein